MPVFLHFTKCKINDHFSYLRSVANIPFLCENTNTNAQHAEEILSFYGNIMKHGSKCYFRAFFHFLFKWLVKYFPVYLDNSRSISLLLSCQDYYRQGGVILLNDIAVGDGIKIINMTFNTFFVLKKTVKFQFSDCLLLVLDYVVIIISIATNCTNTGITTLNQMWASSCLTTFFRLSDHTIPPKMHT